MSDYNVQDKAEGSQWTPQEHNAMKTAVNSKMDKDNLVQDLSNPNGTQFPSTQAVAGILAGSFILRGNLLGSEQIRTGAGYQISGYWVADKGFNNATADANNQYPVGQPGVLRVLKNADHTLLEYITIAEKPRYFICSRVSDQTHFPWTELATPTYLTNNNYCQCSTITTQPGINITDTGTGGIYTWDQVSGETWSRGVIRISADKILENGDMVIADFSWPTSVLANKIVMVDNYNVKNCDVIISFKDDKKFTVVATNFNSIGDVLVEEFYFTFLIQ
ncbi:MAG: hypothetical protein BGO31_14295 [Bacteroidetes bacterium 43-16]|nr:MAG: hypothetical protein BGO31_14295 [Bacteroidetes bacterium 43-16]